MTNNVKIDADLFAALRRLPALPFMRLVRQDRAMLIAARTALARGDAPTFSYTKAQAFPVSAYRESLAAFRGRIAQLAPNVDVATLYERKADELDARARLIAAVQHGDDHAVSNIAQELYGTPSATLEELEAHLEVMLAAAGARKVTVAQWVDAPMFAQMAVELLARYGMHDWRVALARRRTLQVSHSKPRSSPLVRIPRALRLTRRRARQLLAHEIEGHALRYHNGAQSPLHILERGTAGYLLADEGIAMALQQEFAQTSYHWPGFWESYAVALALRFDARTVYRRLATARAALAARMGHAHAERVGERAAWRLCLRIYRGITEPKEAGLVFPRDHVYLSGFRAMQDRDLTALYVGHAALEDMPLLARLGIVPHQPPVRYSRAVVRDVLRNTKAQG